MAKTLFTFLFVFISLCAYTQQNELKQDIIRLKNGSVIKGQIIELIPDSLMTIRLTDGQALKFPLSEIRRYNYKRNKAARKKNGRKRSVPKDSTHSSSTKAPKKKFNKTGFYKNISIGITAGNVSGEDFLLATHFQLHLGRYLGQKSKLGMGIGIENFNLAKGEMIYPLFVEYQYHLLNTVSSPFVGLGAGYSLASGFFDEDVIEVSGGPLAHANVGFRINSVSGAIIDLSLQYRYQKAYFERIEYIEDLFSFPPGPVSSDIYTYDYDYSRVIFSIGLLF